MVPWAGLPGVVLGPLVPQEEHIAKISLLILNHHTSVYDKPVPYLHPSYQSLWLLLFIFSYKISYQSLWLILYILSYKLVFRWFSEAFVL